MDGWAFWLDFYSEFAALSDHGRILNLDFIKLRYNDAIACVTDRFQCWLHLYILLFHCGKLFHRVDQIVFTFHLNPTHFTEYFVIIFVFDLHSNTDTATRQTDFLQHGFLYTRNPEADRFSGDVFDMMKFFHLRANTVQNLCFQLVICRKHLHPFRNKKLNFCHREFIQHIRKNFGDIFFAKLFTVCCHGDDTIFFLKGADKVLCFFFVWCLRIHKKQKRLALFF